MNGPLCAHIFLTYFWRSRWCAWGQLKLLATCNSTFEIWTFQMLMIVDAFANMEPKNLVMDHINITFLVITICRWFWVWLGVLKSLQGSKQLCHVTYQHKNCPPRIWWQPRYSTTILGNLYFSALKWKLTDSKTIDFEGTKSKNHKSSCWL